MRILLPRKMSQHCLLSCSTHAMSASGLGDPKDPCEGTRSWLMDVARRLRFHVLSARNVDRNSPPSPMPEFTSSVSHVHGQSPAIPDLSFYSTRPEQPRPKSFCAPVVSSTAPTVYGAISHGRPAEVRQEAEESSRGDSVSLDFYFRARRANDQPGTASQGSRDSHELQRHCIEESRSLVNNSVSYGPKIRHSTILIKALSTYNETRIESGPHPMGPPRRILAKALEQWLHSQLPSDGPFAKYHARLTNPEDLEHRSDEPYRGAEDKKGRQFYSAFAQTLQLCQHGTRHSRCSPTGSDNNRTAKSFTIQLLPAQKPITLPVEPAVIPTSRDGVGDRETPRNSESPTFFLLHLRDSGSTETAVRMSMKCPQVCATSRLERPLQCVVVVILRLAARRIMLVPHEWTLWCFRGIVHAVNLGVPRENWTASVVCIFVGTLRLFW